MKNPFLEFWSRRKERGELLQKQPTLNTQQLLTLFGDSDVRASLQKSRVASLLPPVGTEVFRRFTPASLEQIQTCMNKNKQGKEDNHLKPSPELKSEKVLPFFYGAPPPELQNVPLEDPDPFYQSQKTFVVVSAGNVLTRFNAESSCFQFSPFGLFRRMAIKILNQKLFTALLFVTLVVNLFFMVPNDLVKGWTYNIMELVFLSIYTVEALLKILSRGFCLGRFTYLRDGWNRLDLFIIVTGFLFFAVPDLLFLKSLRYLKVLGLFSATRRHVKTFTRALNRLWDVFFLTLLVLTVFSLIGLSGFSGSLRNKCVKSWDSSNSSLLSLNQNISNYFDYETYINTKENYYYSNSSGEPQICGNGSLSSACPDGYICLRTDSNPDFGFTNYDSFVFAFLSTFRFMMRDFWEALAAQVMQAEGTPMMIYFVATMFICSFSLTAFIIAAFVITFTEQSEREVKDVKQNQRDYTNILAALKEDENELPKKNDTEQNACAACFQRICSCDCCNCWVQLKNKLQFVVLDPFFDLVIILLIILNVCFMSMEHFPLTPEFEETLSLAELVFTLIFFLEVVVKIFALGPYAYFKVGWHIYDTVLAVLTFLGQFLLIGSGVFEMFRLFRLARWWPGFLKWVRLVGAGLSSSFTLCLGLVVLFFSFFGNHWFMEDFNANIEPGKLPDRWHMGDFFHAFMLVVRALCGEWIETLWPCMKTSNHFSCVAFYVTLLIVGNFLILTLFVTLLMKWINNKLAPNDQEQMNTLKMRILKIFKVCGLTKGDTTTEKPGAAEDKESMALHTMTSEENGTQTSTLPIGEAKNLQKMKEAEDPQEVPENCFCQKCYSCCPALDLDKSQGCGRVWSNLRQSALNIIQHPYFNNFIFVIVLVSSIALVFEDKSLPTQPNLRIFLGYLDQVITYLFVLEVVFKWIGLGFKRYFTDGWCWLDFIVTLACVLSVAAQTSALDSSLISLKAVRPLKILALIKHTRVSVCALFRMLPSVFDLILVISIVWLFFAVLFVHAFAGRFFYCLNETSNEVFNVHEVSNYSTCWELIMSNFTEVRWKNSPINFDSVLSAQLSLFCMATFKGWIDLLYSAVDSTRISDQPYFEDNIYFFLYFVCFAVFGGFFCCIYTIKVLLDSYNSQVCKIGGSHLFLTEKQQKNFINIRFCSKRPLAPCPRPQGHIRGRLFDFVSHEAFEWVMQFFIFATFVLMMLDHYDITEQQETVQHYLMFVLILIFTIEAFLKICAFRWSYFSDNLNVIDFVVVILSLLGLILADVMSKYFILPLIPNSFHLLRLGRVSRIIHRLPGALRIHLLFTAWIKSLPAIFNLALVLFILVFSYASFGTFHFSHLKKTNDVFNFETFGNSLISMLTITTWAGWDGLLYPNLLMAPDCEPIDIPEAMIKADCGSPHLGVAFYLSFLCLSSYVVLVMLLVLLVDMLNIFGELNCDPLSALNMSCFFKAWKKLVPDSSYFIPRSQLPDLCEKLRISDCFELDLSPEDPVHCRDVLLALTVQAAGDSADKEALSARINEVCQEYMPESPSQDSCETSCTVEMNQEAATSVTEEIQE